MLYYSAGAAVIVLAIATYWTRPLRRGLVMARSRNAVVLFGAVASGLALCLWSVMLERPEHVYERQARPVAIAIAFDLSPSMRAVPNPELDGRMPARYERGQAVLLDFLRALEEARQPVIVSVLGFTRSAEIIMGWDQSVGQVRDILEYAVSPDLFASSGTSIEAAVKAIDEAFAMLPDDVLTESRKLAIIVSDGEDTMRASSFDYAREALGRASFDAIALQTGLLDRSEGLAVYGSMGEFSGFLSMRGELFTVPDVAAMTALAEATPGNGLYVRAELPDAARQMADFAMSGDFGRRTPGAAWLSAFGMFAIVTVLMAVIIR
jgi:hypothetical protein